MSENALGKANSDSSPADKELSCSDCGDVFASKTTLSRHRRNFHPENLDHNCPSCDKVFETSVAMKSHHKQKHGESIAGYDKICGVCGEEFNTSKKGVEYCSAECGHKSQRDRVSLECEQCGRKFDAKPSEVEGKRFCSLDCKGNWFSKHVTGESHPSYKSDARIEKACKYCGENFTVASWELGNGKNNGTYCSKECMDQWRREYWVGENNPLYKGGDQYYGENWHSQRRKALKRDQYRCQVCRVTASGLSREPSVHHVTPIRDYDRPEDANAVDNLVTLCESCHSKWEGLYLRPDTR